MVQKIARILKKYQGLLVGLAVLGLLVLLVPTIVVYVATMPRRRNDIDQVPARDVTIVLGAGVMKNGEPTPYLKWRLETAAGLYKAKRTKKLLMSGDNGVTHYNEPQAMKRYAEKLGVRSEDIVLDYAGFSTYDTCYRAQAIFGIRQAIIVTQGYHLPRAVMTCRGLGIDVVGLVAQHQGRDYTVTYIMREYISTDKALLQILVKPKPRLLGEKINL